MRARGVGVLTKPRLPTAEDLLLDYARRLERHRDGRRVLWIHLSRLVRQNRHESDIQLAANLMRPLARRFNGDVFALASGDTIVCLKDPEEHSIERALVDLRRIFAQDPLIAHVDAEGPRAYLTVYDLAKAYPAFYAAAVTACTPGAADEQEAPASERTQGARHILSADEVRRRARPTPVPGHVDTSQGRIAVERLLERTAIARFDEAQVARGWGRREILREQSLDAFESIATLYARRQLTQSSALAEIERLVLATWGELMRSESELTHLLMLRTETLISAEFLSFDRALSSGGATRPLIGFFLDDILADKPTAEYLQGFLRERGYRFGLTGLSLGALGQARGALAGMSFLEIAMPIELTKADKELLSRLIAECGGEFVLASAIANTEALKSVFEAGVRLASGAAVGV
jgi:hypothetical protein